MAKRKPDEGAGFSVFALDKSNKLLTKRFRSCLQCQQRKVKCRLPEIEPFGGCIVCQTKGDRCSLLVQPSSPRAQSSTPTTRTATPQGPRPPFEQPSAGNQFTAIDWLSFIEQETTNDNFPFFSSLLFSMSPGSDAGVPQLTHQDTVIPIDGRIKDVSYEINLPSGEYDPMLRFHYYQYNTNDECLFSSKFFRKMGTPEQPIIFACKPRAQQLKENKEIITRSVPREVFERLSKFIPNFVVLYLKFVFQYLPILDGHFLHEIFSNEAQEYNRNKEDIDILLLLLMAKSVRRWDTYDTSIDMFTDDDEWILNNRQEFLTYTWDLICEQLHAPDLSTLKAMILFYQELCFKKDIHPTAFEKSVASSMVTLGFSLGIHIDCSDWKIPRYEKNLRTRLWWTVYTHEKWSAFAGGHPSVINDSEYSVQVPENFEEIFDDVSDYLSQKEGAVNFFERSLKLTFILNEIWHSLFSLRALSKSKNEVTKSCDVLAEKLAQWRDGCSDVATQPELNTLVLSSYVLDLALFKARFKVLDIQNNEDQVLDKAVELVTRIVQLLKQLPIHCINGFWHAWSSSLFLYIKDFFMLLIMTASNKEQSHYILNLVRQFREWLEANTKNLAILWSTLVRLNIATQGIGTQFKRLIDRDQRPQQRQ